MIFFYFRLSLVLRKGKEEIERVKYLLSASSGSLSSSPPNSSVHRRQAQTDADTELVSSQINETQIRAAIIETQNNAEELQQRVKVIACSFESQSKNCRILIALRDSRL